MELKYLRTFKTILDVGSFQNAAEKLNYSQSTVTFQIQQLEKALSVKLFDKIGRKMIISQAGKDLLPHINKVLETISFIESYGKSFGNMSGELTVSMPETLLTYKIQTALQLFRKQAPGVELSLQTKNCLAIREQILSGDVDMGFYYDIGGDNASIQTEELSRYDLALICSPALQREDRDFITPHKRKALCLLTDDKNSIFFTVFSEYLHDKGIIMGNILELGSIEAIKRSVSSNLGVAFLPRFTVEQEITSGILDELVTEIRDPRITAVYSYHKNKWISPAMERFIYLMKGTL